MDAFTITAAASACNGRLCCEQLEDRELGKIVIDSRAVEPGDLFAAYKGERVDGHDYIAAAFDKGAACCLAERLPKGERRPVILVPDVQQALEQIAEAYRKTLNLPVIGITGSVGKTSAKEMIAAVLSSRFSILKTEGNLNNQIGVPMTISRISRTHEAAVVEMGISGFGEMQVLSRIARPSIGVFTVIGHAHLEFLHDLQGVLKAKTEMLDNMADDAVIVVNGDDGLLRDFSCRQRKLTVGLSEGCELRAEELRLTPEGHTACTLVYGDRRIPVQIPDFGKHMVYAALEGAAVGILMGLRDEEIARGIGAFRAVGRRFAVTQQKGFTLIDDSYNANPDSVKCGIDSLMTLPGRPVCILGDMLELGENGPAMHEDVGRYARQQGVSAVLTSGELGACIAAGAGAVGEHFESREALMEALPRRIRPGDVVLVKASLGAGFGKVAEALKALELDGGNGERT